jgi:hypothetical protein
MVNVVPAAGNRPPARVLPKVFADVPSQRELDDARKARKSMSVWVVLLVALLLGAGGLIAWEVLIGRPAIAEGIKTETEKFKEAETKRLAAEKSLKEEQGKYARLFNLYQPFETIAVAEEAVADLKSQIKTRVAEYPDARARTLVSHRAAWAAYDSSVVWKGANKDEVGQDLKGKQTLLNDLLQRIVELQPPAPNPRPPACPDPTGCGPSPTTRPN